jgi:23S rRNA pseudouridine1911/1915/1917 synthase
LIITIPEELQGKRLDQALAILLPEYSRTKLSEFLKDGQILLNSSTAKAKISVNTADILDVNITTEPYRLELKPEDIPLDIVYEDEHLLIINKPKGLVVHPGAKNYEHTLVNALLFHDPKLECLPRAGIIHRLDKDTTGLLISAKTLESYHLLVKSMQERLITRRYMALVHGHVTHGRTLNTGYGRDAHNRIKMAVHNIPAYKDHITSFKRAITEFVVVEQYHYLTLIDLRLHTGRTHQIRVHMTHLRHPIVGDRLYTANVKYKGPLPENIQKIIKQFDSQALHAYLLEFNHPIKQQPLHFEIALPDNFQQAIDELEGNDLALL